MSDSELIVLRNIAKTYRRGDETISIFTDLNLSIPQGDFVAMMGPSGSGKTTLLNLLGGLDRPTGGTILFDGAPIEKLSESQLSAWRAANIGFIFQFYNLMPTMSAARNVELPLLLTQLGSVERKRRVKTALEIVGLDNRAGHKPKELSGGQQQRVAIARAIVADPKLILADEPTGNLDAATGHQIIDLMFAINAERGTTLILVTHDEEIAARCGRRLRMHAGRLEELPA